MRYSLLFIFILLFYVSALSLAENANRLSDWLEIPVLLNRHLWDDKNECNWIIGKERMGGISSSYAAIKDIYLGEPAKMKWLEMNWDLGCRDWLVAYYHYLPNSPRFQEINGDVKSKVEMLLLKQDIYFGFGGDFERNIGLMGGEWKTNPIIEWLENNCNIDVAFDEVALANRDEIEVLKQTIAIEKCLAWLERIVKYDDLWMPSRFVIAQFFMSKFLTTTMRADSLSFRLKVHSTLCRYLWEHKDIWMKALAVVESERALDFYINFRDENWKTYIGITYESRVVSFFKDYITQRKGMKRYSSVPEWELFMKEYLLSVPAERRIAIVQDPLGWSGIEPEKRSFLAGLFTYFCNERPKTPRLYFKRRHFLASNPPIETEVDGKKVLQASPRTPGEAFELFLADDFLPYEMVLMRFFIKEQEVESCNMPDFLISISHISHHETSITVCWESNKLVRFFYTTFNRKAAFCEIERQWFDRFEHTPLYKSIGHGEISGEIQGSVIDTNELLVKSIKQNERDAAIRVTGVTVSEHSFIVYTQIGESDFSFIRSKDSTEWRLYARK